MQPAAGVDAPDGHVVRRQRRAAGRERCAPGDPDRGGTAGPARTYPPQHRRGRDRDQRQRGRGHGRLGVGLDVGPAVGVPEGADDGVDEGVEVGFAVGVEVGVEVGLEVVGEAVGVDTGPPENVPVTTARVATGLVPAALRAATPSV